ncbi:MAG: WYL domain-containing protein [Bacteroidaceae bacterium]|nr:WYL domain-containing protein [Bacteroidaceae bacterium]
MSQSIIQRYMWFFDTVWRYKRITRGEIERLWLQSDLSDGNPLTRRTFCNYREGAENLFDVNILCDTSTYEYYIEQAQPDKSSDLQKWLFDSLSVNYLMRHGADMAERIIPEHIPSGNDYMATITEAMQQGHVIRMTYHAFWKMSAQKVELEPYFVKAFRKRWYVIGYNRKDRHIKTYALDRVVELSLTTDTFEFPADFNPANYFAQSFGVIRSDEQPEAIRLRATMRQAQYLRALPLHHSQREYEVGDGYVDFIYNMYITYDLIQELLSLGREIEVISPAKLRNEIRNKLQAALDLYK